MTTTPITEVYLQSSNGWPVPLIRKFMKYGAMEPISGPNWPPKAHLVGLAIKLGITVEEAEEWRAGEPEKPIERIRIMKEGGVGGEGGSNDVGDEDGVNESNEAMQAGEEDQTEDFGECAGDTADKSTEQTETETESQGTDNGTSTSFTPIAQHLHGSAQPQPLTGSGSGFQRWTIEERHDHLLTAIGGDVLPVDYQTPSASTLGNLSSISFPRDQTWGVSVSSSVPNPSSTTSSHSGQYPELPPTASNDSRLPNISFADNAQNQVLAVPGPSNAANVLNNNFVPDFQNQASRPPPPPPSAISAPVPNPAVTSRPPPPDPFDPNALPSQVNANNPEDPWFPFMNRRDAEESDPMRFDDFGVFKRNGWS